jgi:hypothetical protein
MQAVSSGVGAPCVPGVKGHWRGTAAAAAAAAARGSW